MDPRGASTAADSLSRGSRTLSVFARRELVVGRLDDSQDALLLEGSWPEEVDSRRRWSLDELIDCRFAWIDEEAARVAEELAAAPCETPSLVYLNAVRLRYELVKLLRVVAWSERLCPLQRGDPLRAVLQRDRDEGYGRLLEALAEKHAWRLMIRWESPAEASLPSERDGPPPVTWWRRWASRMNRWTGVPERRGPRPRILLCGNPRHLDPICGELLRRRAQPWWLYERFAVGSWLRWRWAGVGQWVCDQSLPEAEPLPLGAVEDRVDVQGIDLRTVLEPWLRTQAESLVARQSRLVAQIALALHRLQPDCVVVDQDGTPLSRALIALARWQRFKSRTTSLYPYAENAGSRIDFLAAPKTCVVQHGVPLVRFGFSPLTADCVFAWGESSRRQLAQWNVPLDRIVVTGSPAHDRTRVAARPSTPDANRVDVRPRQFLLLATVPPHDKRPDLIAYHCTTQSYRRMLHNALSVVGEYEDARLLIKPHPRDTEQHLLREALQDFPALDATIVRHGTVEQYAAEADCVLACASSSGVEATLCGVPVVQLMPEGSCDLIDAAEWGLLGTARTVDELRTLIDRALYDPTARPEACNPSVLGESTRPSAVQIVDHLLNRISPRSLDRNHIEQRVSAPAAS